MKRKLALLLLLSFLGGTVVNAEDTKIIDIANPVTKLFLALRRIAVPGDMVAFRYDKTLLLVMMSPGEKNFFLVTLPHHSVYRGVPFVERERRATAGYLIALEEITPAEFLYWWGFRMGSIDYFIYLEPKKSEARHSTEELLFMIENGTRVFPLAGGKRQV